MNETKPKKVVSRNVAIALGIICIVLIASLAGAFAYYVSTHNHSNSEYDTLQSRVNGLTDEVNGDKNIVLINQIIILESNFTSLHVLVNETGWLLITVTSLNQSNYLAYVQTIWNVSAFNISYDWNDTYLSNMGIPAYQRVPVLVLPQSFNIPYSGNYTTDVEVRIGGNAHYNINPIGYLENVTIMYYY